MQRVHPLAVFITDLLYCLLGPNAYMSIGLVIDLPNNNIH